MIVKFLTIGEAHPDGTRTLFFELNGQPREVTIRYDRAPAGRRAQPSQSQSRRRRPSRRSCTAACLVSSIAVQVNHPIERGAKLLTLEAMKMQSNIYAPISGLVTKLHVASGQHVEAKDLSGRHRSVSAPKSHQARTISIAVSILSNRRDLIVYLPRAITNVSRTVPTPCSTSFTTGKTSFDGSTGRLSPEWIGM